MARYLSRWWRRRSPRHGSHFDANAAARRRIGAVDARRRVGDAADAAADSAEDGDAAESAAPDTSRANELNKRWSGWAFQLPDFRHDTLNRGMDELVEAEDEADGDGDDEAGG